MTLSNDLLTVYKVARGFEAAIAEAAHTIGLAENRLPSIFSAAEIWVKRLQSDVEVGAALKAIVDRVDLLLYASQARSVSNGSSFCSHSDNGRRLLPPVLRGRNALSGVA